MTNIAMKELGHTLAHLPLLAVLLALGTVASGCGPDTPDAPEDLSAESEEGAVALNWSAVEGGSLSGYNVYRSESAFKNTEEAQRINNSPISRPSYTDQGAQNRKTYHYRITAVAMSDGFLGIGGGTEESSTSDMVEKTPFSRPPNRP